MWPLIGSQTNDNSHDLDIWPTNFIPISIHQYQHLHYCISMSWLHSGLLFVTSTLLLYLFIITVCILNRFKNLVWASSRTLKGLLWKTTSRSMLIKIPVVVAWEEYLQLQKMKTTNRSHSKWWVGRLARHSISPTLKDVIISFNNPPYYLMSSGDGRVVFQAGNLGNEA